jgi:lipopolysaccharide transport system permease protein
VFAFVFGQIFQSRWPEQYENFPFWLMLFTGLVFFNLFSETVSRSTTSVRSFPSYVKKIIFPVTILPVVPLGTALIHAIFNVFILSVALILTSNFHLSICLLPVIVIPLLFLAMGFSWFLAAWGVFIKDMSQIVPIFIQMLLFLSPVLYPVSAVPETLRPIYRYSPVSIVIESGRNAVAGLPIDWEMWSIALVVGVVVCLLGYAFFQHNRDEFSDAL